MSGEERARDERVDERDRKHRGGEESARDERDRKHRGGEDTTSSRGAENVLSVRDLRVWYGTELGAAKAVNGVSFDLRPGETLGLVGESGCGKTTLGRGLLGLLPRGAFVDGDVTFHGKPMPKLGSKEHHALRGTELGMIFQEPMTRLNPLMRISEHFSEALKAHHPDMPEDEVRHASLEVLRVLGIPPTRFRSYPHEFSGGMRQRLTIALALVLRPSFIVADEPTTALDVLVEAQIIRILAEVRREFDTSLLLITHNLGIVAEACDRVAVMYAGRIVEIGDARAVFREPQHPYTQELLRSTISLQTTGLNFIPGAPPDLIDPPPGCLFHPRCPHAMRVCTSQSPVPLDVPPDQRVECWLHGPEADIPEGGREHIERQELSVADEA